MKLSISCKVDTLNEFVGQDHLLGINKPLRHLIDSKLHSHLILYGPTGTGKTSLARIIAKELGLKLIELSATSIKTDDLREHIPKDKYLFKPLIFIDEVHRLTRVQQEFLLPHLEKENILFIGASNYNPLYSLVAGIRSRVNIFELKELNRDELNIILNKAMKFKKIDLSFEIKSYLIHACSGDVRKLLNMLDLINDKMSLEDIKNIKISAEASFDLDAHYDLISALIKSMRGSDPNAALYYLSRLIKADENVDFLTRRLVIFASEDIGNANIDALEIAVNTMVAANKIGLPEARIILAQCVIYLSCSPKSNSAYEAINRAMDDIEHLEIPKTIRSEAENYLYPHDYGGYVKQRYIMKDKEYLTLRDIGFERVLKEWLRKYRI